MARTKKTDIAKAEEITVNESMEKKAEETVSGDMPQDAEQKGVEYTGTLETVATTFTEEQVQAMIAKAVAEATAQFHKDSGEQMVTLLYLAEVSPENTLILPGYGSLRPHSYLEVSKREFGSKFMSALARKLIERRHLLVVDGLTKDERQRWGCDYKSGEVLDERVFDKMLDYSTEEIADIFRHLCREHQEFVAKRFITAHERKDNRVSLAKVRALNQISKESGEELFRPIIEAYKADM